MPSNIERVAAAVMHLFIIVLTPKGGVGKSLLAALLARYLLGEGRMPHVVSVDSRHPTRRFLKRVGVPVTIADLPDGDELAADPHAVMRAFAPVQSALNDAAGTADIMLDLGSPGSRPFMEYAIRSELAERLQAAGYRPVVIVPATAQSEAIALAGDTLSLARDVFGELAHMVLVENRRDGSLPNDGNASMKRLLGSADARLVMEALPPHWTSLDAVSILPGELLSMPPAEIGALLGESEDMVRVIRGGMRTWSARLERAFAKAIPDMGPIEP